VAVALNLLLNWFFTLQLGGSPRAGTLPACIATSNFLILYFLYAPAADVLETGAMVALLRKADRRGSRPGRGLLAGRHFPAGRLGHTTFLAQARQSAATIVAAGLIFLLVASALEDPRAARTSSRLRTRLRRKRAG